MIPLVETAVAVVEIAEAVDAVSVETEADEIIDVIQDVDVIADVILVEAEVGVIIVEIQGVTAKTEMMKKNVQRNAIEKPAESAPDMHTIEGRNQYDLGDIRAEIETIEVKT